VRRITADSLGNLGDSRAAEPLLAALQRSFVQDVDDSIFKRSVAAALAKLGVSPEGNLLLALHDTSDAVRQRAMIALGQVWHIPELSALVSESAQVRRDAAKSLGRIGDTRVSEALVAALRDRDEQVRRNAIVSLGHIWQLPNLIALGDDDASAREKAILALEKSVDKRVTQPLFAMLRDADLRVRRRAARALKALGESDDVSLIAMLRDEDRKTRRDAALALARIGGKLSLDSLIIALHDERRYVRETALEALAKLGNPAVETLANALVSHDPELSLGAVQALRRIGTVEASTVLHDYYKKTR
jgi:HEAT repeat protein